MSWQHAFNRGFGPILVLAFLAGKLVAERRRRLRAEAEARRYLEAAAHMDRCAALGELTASLTHELSQPLAAILRNAEAARMLLESGGSVTELHDIVEDIRKSDKRATDLLERMWKLLRRQELELRPVDVNGIVRDMVELVASDAARGGIRVRLETLANPSVVTGDRVHLEQVLLNVVLNSIDVMRRMNGSERQLILRTVQTNGHVSVDVRDSGPGIPGSVLPRIFEPFFTTKSEGLGMGLSIARSIVEAHGGRINAENNPDGGATVRVSLPLRRQAA